jgi:AcrR family transcriptional regulator
MATEASISRPARRGRPPSRAIVEAALLDAAAEQINASGAAAVSLGELSTKVGVSRSALYYYCSDANDLVFRCFLRSCERLGLELEAVAALSASAEQKLVALIDRTLAMDRAPLAVLDDIAYLPLPMRDEVTRRASANVRKLANIVELGQREGGFRALEAEQVAHLILSSISWPIIWRPWQSAGEDVTARRHYVDTLTSVLLHGVAASGVDSLGCKIEYDRLMARPTNAFDRQQTAHLKSEQILGVASRLFNAMGLDGVRLDDVSAAIGITKGAIYHHFTDKSELIARCYDRAFNIYDCIMRVGIERGANPLEQAIIVTHLNAQAQLAEAPPLTLFHPGFARLTGKKRDNLRLRAHGLSGLGIDLLKRARAEGTCRALDMNLVPEIMAGAFLGLPRHAPPDRNPLQLADFVTDMLMFGLKERR